MMYVCSTAITGLDIHGSISKKTHLPNIYHVQRWPQPSCTCPAYAINRNKAISIRTEVQQRYPDAIAWCKHLDNYIDKLCSYNTLDRFSATGTDYCPLCGNPTQAINIVDLTETEAKIRSVCKDCERDIPKTNTNGLCDECVFDRI